MKYAVKKCRITGGMTPEQYNDAISRAPIQYFKTFTEVTSYCGVRLSRCGCGYAGSIGEFEFVAYKIA